jgi:hypothetical protein
VNTAFKLANVELNISGVKVKIGEISTEVKNYNLLEGLEIIKALPAVVRELTEIFAEFNEVNLHQEQRSHEFLKRLNEPTSASNPLDEAIVAMAKALDVEPEQINVPQYMPDGFAEAHGVNDPHTIGFVQNPRNPERIF